MQSLKTRTSIIQIILSPLEIDEEAMLLWAFGLDKGAFPVEGTVTVFTLISATLVITVVRDRLILTGYFPDYLGGSSWWSTVSLLGRL